MMAGRSIRVGRSMVLDPGGTISVLLVCERLLFIRVRS